MEERGMLWTPKYIVWRKTKSMSIVVTCIDYLPQSNCLPISKPAGRGDAIGLWVNIS